MHGISLPNVRFLNPSDIFLLFILHKLVQYTFEILTVLFSGYCLISRPTFYRVYRKKSTEGFQCVPYVVALFSAMLWIYYALLKPNSYLLITINTIGCIIETAYIIVYLVYAPKKAKVKFIYAYN